MTSKKMRENPLFMRNSYKGQGHWNIPLVRKQEIDTSEISLIACSDTRNKENRLNCANGVHFFVDDYRFEGIYTHPERTLEKYRQYAFLLTPDFSTYADMDLWRQLESVAKKSLGGCILAGQRTDSYSNNKLEYTPKFWFLL